MKIKLALPKKGFFKKNLFIVLAFVCLLVFLMDIFCYNYGRRVKLEIKNINNMLGQASQAKAKLKSFYRDKPYLQNEDFNRKITFAEIMPTEGMKKAGIIIRQEGSFGKLTLTEEVSKDSAFDRNNKNNTQGLINLGTTKIKQLGFNVTFFAYYDDLVRILEKIPSSEPLLVIRKFEIEKNADDPRLLNVELGLSSFTAVNDKAKTKVELMKTTGAAKPSPARTR
ncbi:MAG: hypothetical protein PHU64_04100 [Candidatus Omnitrophica bacterium]|nr:hypothetical protein [Candidatus Omnitrophota bacterium]MDD5429272.1 hypothetical protein [Candidatus Omnitrophota bacterium]